MCKYQKNHINYGEHCDKEDLTLLAQLGEEPEDGGDEVATQTGPAFGDENDPNFASALSKAQQFIKKYAQASEIPDGELPEQLDFRNIDGYDFTSYFRDQGHCGSCYTISFTQVMEARLKLKYGKQPPMLSPQ